MTNKRMNEYDETKKMLNRIRQIQETSKSKYGMIKEQEAPVEDPYRNANPIKANPATSGEDNTGEEREDIAVINDVEVEIHSEDPEDLALEEDEKGKISQLIDDFRTEVSETVEFDKLHIYPDSVKLDGKLGNMGLTFTLSTGDDTGLYINTSMFKVEDESLDSINKLKGFEAKFSNAMNDLLVNRKTT